MIPAKPLNRLLPPNHLDLVFPHCGCYHLKCMASIKPHLTSNCLSRVLHLECVWKYGFPRWKSTTLNFWNKSAIEKLSFVKTNNVSLSLRNQRATNSVSCEMSKIGPSSGEIPTWVRSCHTCWIIISTTTSWEKTFPFCCLMNKIVCWSKGNANFPLTKDRMATVSSSNVAQPTNQPT